LVDPTEAAQTEAVQPGPTHASPVAEAAALARKGAHFVEDLAEAVLHELECAGCAGLFPKHRMVEHKYPLPESKIVRRWRGETTILIKQWICLACWKKYLASRQNRLRLKIGLFLVAVALAAVAAHFLIGVASDQRDPLRDTAILLVAYLIALTSLFLAYEAGGRVWVIRHALITDGVRSVDEEGDGGGGLIGVILHAIRPVRVDVLTPAEPPAGGKSQAEPKDRRLYRGWILRRRLIPAHAVRHREHVVKDDEPHDKDKPHGWKHCISGFWGEALIVTVAIAICIAVVWLCDQASIIAAVRRYRYWIYGLAVAAALVVGDYSVRQVAWARSVGRKDAYCNKLEAAYAAYWVYASFLFLFGAVILSVQWLQFFDAQHAVTLSQTAITGYLNAASIYDAIPTYAHHADAHTYYDLAMQNVERAFGALSQTEIYMQRQMDPVFLFAALLVVINIVITHTDLRHLFTNDGRAFTFIFTYGPMVLIVLVGAFVFKISFEVMMNQIAHSLQALTMRGAPPDQVRRLAEIRREVNGGNNILGFAMVMSGSGSAAAIFGWFLKEVLDRVRTREAIVEAGGELMRRPSQRFRPTSAARTPPAPAKKAAASA
jgi:hypothetical protein